MDNRRSRSVMFFGPFDVDLRTQEIRRQGTVVRLSGQPFQILEMLLTRPGTLVSRDELQQCLWPGSSLVDCTHGLNAAINKLREALGDSAITPQYIETLPRRGYRFIAEVRERPSEETTFVIPVLTPLSGSILPISPAQDDLSEHIEPRRWPLTLVASVALMI